MKKLDIKRSHEILRYVYGLLFSFTNIADTSQTDSEYSEHTKLRTCKMRNV